MAPIAPTPPVDYLQVPHAQPAVQQMQKSLTHLGNGMALLQWLDTALLGHRSVRTFMIAGPLLGIAPASSHILHKPVSRDANVIKWLHAATHHCFIRGN